MNQYDCPVCHKQKRVGADHRACAKILKANPTKVCKAQKKKDMLKYYDRFLSHLP